MTRYRGRRFPLPWTIKDSGYCFRIEDAEGKHLALIFYRTGGGGDAAVFAKDLNYREAELIARNIAKLPELRAKRRAP